MDNPPELLRVLIAEDNPSDAELLLSELRRAGFAPDWVRVSTESDYLKNLHPGLDLILSEYAMPQLSGLQALKLLKERGLGVPFILVSRTIDEETAVLAMKAGVTDYLFKDRLTRFGAAVNQALEQRCLRDERRKAEERLKIQGQQYRLLFETNPNPMWVFDTKTLQILAANEAASAQYGYSRSEFLKLNLKDLRPPEDVPDLIRARALSSPRPTSHFSGQFRHLRKDGSLLVVEIYSGSIVWEGVPARIVTAIDVTERKRAEERLHEQAEIINRAHDAIIIRNFEDRRIVFWNCGAERLYGWTAAEVMGRIDEPIWVDPEQLESMMTMLQSTGEFRGEVKQLAKDGRELITEDRATLVRNANGTPRSIVIICNDVTEKKKLETQLLRAQRLESIGTLASGVAHDLNNILTPILVCTQTLRDRPAEEDIPSIISLIEDSARRGASVVKQVLTFARGVEGERVAIKPSHLVQEMIEIAQKTFPKSIEFRSRYSDDLWSIEADPTQLHQVLLNLAVNARDAMPNGGSLTIAAENFQVEEHYASMMPDAKPGPHVLFRVSDTGIGMPRTVMDKIFDPFFTTKDVGKGTGLGLSTALGIVKSHGGFISVYSEIGAGTTFKIFLPAQASEAAADTPEISLDSLSGNGELILVVDDEPNILRATKMMLEKHRYRVVTANDAPEALAFFAQQMDSIKVVLTDMTMPHVDGVTLIRAIKKMKPGTMFIASTGQGAETRAAELRTLDVTNFLTKPYDTQVFLRTIHRTLTGADTSRSFELAPKAIERFVSDNARDLAPAQNGARTDPVPNEINA